MAGPARTSTGNHDLLETGGPHAGVGCPKVYADGWVVPAEVLGTTVIFLKQKISILASRTSNYQNSIKLLPIDIIVYISLPDFYRSCTFN